MTDPNEDFVSFEKALRDLKLQSEQLKKMVSQGDIRAFRVGDSMQFRAEDVAALKSQSEGEEELVFADALEDDTGMVTEELSEEDTLLVEDDLDDDEEELSPSSPRVAQRSRREAMATTAPEATEHPVWSAIAIICFIGLLWGSLVSWSIAAESPPEDNFFTQLWSSK